MVGWSVYVWSPLWENHTEIILNLKLDTSEIKGFWLIHKLECTTSITK